MSINLSWRTLKTIQQLHLEKWWFTSNLQLLIQTYFLPYLEVCRSCSSPLIVRDCHNNSQPIKFRVHSHRGIWVFPKWFLLNSMNSSVAMRSTYIGQLVRASGARARVYGVWPLESTKTAPVVYSSVKLDESDELDIITHAWIRSNYSPTQAPKTF